MKKFFLFLLLACIGQTLQAQYVNFIVSSLNLNSSTIGTAKKGQRLSFTYIIINNTSTPITNGTVITTIPAGTEYIAGTTTLNLLTVADADGKMPYTVPGGANIGTIAPGAQAMVMFTVTVTGNAGTVINNAIFKGNQNSVYIYQEASGGNTTLSSYYADSLYGTTAFLDIAGTYSVIAKLNTYDGTASTVYTGNTGLCYDAISGNQLANGSLVKKVSAIAADDRNRIFFINEGVGSNLGYLNLLGDPVPALTYGDGNYVLSSTSSINRMGFSSTGDGYALTTDGTDLIRFTVGASLPVITHLGTLQNDPLNGTYNVLTEVSGDIFGDCNGKIYFIGTSGNLYRIDPDTRISTYLGTISGLSNISEISSAAFDGKGDYLYIHYSSTTLFPLSAKNKIYKVDLSTMTASLINQGTINYYADYGSGSYPVLSSPLTATHSWRDISNNFGFIIASDPIEMTITVTNTGNIVATGARVYNPIPTGATYISNSTTLNGVAVADDGGMPFAVTGGGLIGPVKPGTANSVVVKFRIRTLATSTTCNQPVVIYPALDGSTVTVNAETISSANGTQIAPCFYTEGDACSCGRTTLSGSLNDYQSDLNWVVESEENIAYYELEYASDNINFNKVGKINVGAKSFTDAVHNNFGFRNYRLKIVENNGRVSYSDTVQLNLKGVVRVNPNPFTNQLNLRIDLAAADNVIIRLMDVNGKVVYTTSEKLNAGGNSLQLAVPANLAAGVYLSEVYAGNTRILQKKLVKL